MSNAKKLFRVLSAGGVLEGDFASKSDAKKFRNSFNSRLKPGDRVAWVSVGPDHWRWNTDRSVPVRHHVDTKPWNEEPVQAGRSPVDAEGVREFMEAA